MWVSSPAQLILRTHPSTQSQQKPASRPPLPEAIAMTTASPRSKYVQHSRPIIPTPPYRTRSTMSTLQASSPLHCTQSTMSIIPTPPHSVYNVNHPHPTTLSLQCQPSPPHYTQSTMSTIPTPPHSVYNVNLAVTPTPPHSVYNVNLAVTPTPPHSVYNANLAVTPTALHSVYNVNHPHPTTLSLQCQPSPPHHTQSTMSTIPTPPHSVYNVNHPHPTTLSQPCSHYLPTLGQATTGSSVHCHHLVGMHSSTLNSMHSFLESP